MPDIKAEAAKVKRRRAFQALKANRRDKVTIVQPSRYDIAKCSLGF
jgi:hypothetical protein